MRLWQLLGSALGCPLGDNAKHLAWRHALALATAGDLRFWCVPPAGLQTVPCRLRRGWRAAHKAARPCGRH